MAVRYVLKIRYYTTIGEEKTKLSLPQEFLPEAERLFFQVLDIVDGRRPTPKNVAMILSCHLYQSPTADKAEAYEMVRKGRAELLRSDRHRFPDDDEFWDAFFSDSQSFHIPLAPESKNSWTR